MFALLLCAVCADPIEFDADQTCFSLNGTTYASVGEDGMITIGDLRRGDKTSEISGGKITDILWAGKHLVTTGPDGTHVYEGMELKSVLPAGKMMASDGRILCVKDEGENLYTFQVGSFNQLKTLKNSNGYFKDPVGMVAQRGVCAVGCKKGGLAFRNLSTGSGRGTEILKGVELEHYTTNGDWHVVSDKDGVYKISVRERDQIDKICGPGYPVFDPVGQLIVFGEKVTYYDKRLQFQRLEPGVGDVVDVDFWGRKPVVDVGRRILVVD